MQSFHLSVERVQNTLLDLNSYFLLRLLDERNDCTRFYRSLFYYFQVVGETSATKLSLWEPEKQYLENQTAIQLTLACRNDWISVNTV